MIDKGTGKRLTIGLFITWIEDSYHLPIWKAIEEKAAEQDINLLIFAGDAPNTAAVSENPLTSIYDLANEEQIQGLIIVASSISNFITSEQLKTFCNKYRSIPIVTIGNPLEGVPAVLIDNKQGTYELTKHLIVEHGYERFAFFSGPERNAEGLLRFQGFTAALREFNIPFNDNLVIEGDFSYRYHKVLDTIFDFYKQRNFNALVCANDYMAMNSILQFMSAGYKIPKDIAITGFDDIPAARHLNPPLTTVRQPLSELGAKALTLLLGRIFGKIVPGKLYLPTQVIIRQSCGCLSYSVNHAGEKSKTWKTGKRKKTGLSKSSLISHLVFSLKIPVQKREKVKAWLDEFIAVAGKFLANGNKINDVIYTFSDILPELPHESGLDDYWQNFQNQIKESLVAFFTAPEERRKILLIFRKINIHLSELLLRTNTYKTLRFWEENNELNIVNYHITSSFDYPNLVEHIARDLPALRIKSCFIAEYEDKIYTLDKLKYFLSRWSKLYFAFRDFKMVDINPDESKFFTRRLLPPGLLPQERYVFFVLPLFIDTVSFGYILFHLSNCNPSTYISLQATISSAMVAANSIEEMKATKEIAESANRIKSQFLANMSHEIRTPLNFILGFTDLLLDDEHDADKKKRLETINRAGKNLLAIINDILDFSRIESGKIELRNEVFSLPQFFQHLKNMFSLESVRKNLVFQMEIPDSMPKKVIGDEQRIMQVMINLLDNAFKFTEKGLIRLKSGYKNGIITIIVSDTGIGIPEDKWDELFSPFQQADSSTTRKYGGTGLGLAITHNLVEKMGGDIALSSKLGQGSTFTVKFPLKSGAELENENPDKLPAVLETVNRVMLPAGFVTAVNSISIDLDNKQREKLRQIAVQLRKCLKIFDEDRVKLEADNLLLVSSHTAFSVIREKLYRAAENYESTAIDALCAELESMVQTRETADPGEPITGEI